MKIRIARFLFISFILLPGIAISQGFYFKCTYKKKSGPPVLFVVPQDDVFNMFYRLPWIKDSDSSFHLNLMPSEINFFKINGDVVLVSPGEHVEGYFSNPQFYPYDSSSVNFKLKEISDRFTAIWINYGIGSSFEKFKSVFNSLKNYVNSTDSVINVNIKPWHDSRVEFALKEYLETRLAHYLVLPILYKNAYDEKELVSMIQKNIQIRFPEYWLQLETGRIFLHTYYRKMVLPDSKFDLQKSLSGKMYAIPGFRKLATYDYFQECLDRATLKTKKQLLADYQQALSKLQLSIKEQDEMKEYIYMPIQKIGTDISDVFATLPIENSSGQLLTESQKKSLIAHENIILDFWASWCVPCRARMEKLHSGNVMIDHKQYHIIYLSIDENAPKWKSAFYPFLNKSNSFRITSPDNEFVKDFAISSIPRYILINQSGLISSEFSFE